MFHHRYPTSTDNTKTASHPFSTRKFFDTNYVLVHNGVISNSYELRKKHEELGIKYHSTQPNGRFNDSEALLWDVALYLEGQQEELTAKGTIAFICIAQSKDKKSDKLYFARNTNPLNMFFNKKKGLFLSSEGKGQPITAHQLYTFDYNTKKMSNKSLRVPTNYSPPLQHSYDSGESYEPYGFRPTTSTPNWRDVDFDEEEFLEQYYKNPSKVNADRVKKIREDLGIPEDEEDQDSFYDDGDGLDVGEVPPALQHTALSYTDDVETQERDIKTRFVEYIKRAEGHITTAYNMAIEDSEWLDYALSVYVQENDEPDMDLEYEINVQGAAIECMITDSAWDDVDAIHPLWDGKVPPQPKTPIEAQQRLIDLEPIDDLPTAKPIGTVMDVVAPRSFAANSVQAIIQSKLDKLKVKVPKGDVA